MVELGTATNLESLGLKAGAPSIKSVGPLAFGPGGVLFIADNVGASIFAVDAGDGGGETEAVNLDNFDASLASYLGCSRDDVAIRDMAVHPASGKHLPFRHAGQRRRCGSGDCPGVRGWKHQRRAVGERGVFPV